MKTLDGYELKEGDDCWVSCMCRMGEHKLSPNPRKAKYLDDYAKENGWMFSIQKQFKTDCPSVEIIAVWKNNPENKKLE